MANLMQGLPGLGTSVSTFPREILKSDAGVVFMTNGVTLNGTVSGDAGNTGDLDVLRNGMLISEIEATGLYRNTIIGKTNGNYEGSELTLSLSAADATELSRSVGSSGTFYIWGVGQASPEDLDAALVTYSAVNTTSGAVTITSLANEYGSGSLVIAADAVSAIHLQSRITDDTWIQRLELTQTYFFDEPNGIKVTDSDGTTRVNVPVPKVIVAGQIDTDRIINYPSDDDAVDALQFELRRYAMGLTFSS